MTLTQSIKTCLRKYATFKGRASRSEFWWWVLFTQILYLSLILIGFACIDRDLIGSGAELNSSNFYKLSGSWVVVWLIYVAIIITPVAAAGCRRLHDIGKSGHWNWIWLTGLGCYVLLYWWSLKSEVDENKYGPAPYA